MKRVPRRTWLYVVLLLSFGLNVFGAHWGLPGLWHPDEITARSVRMVLHRSADPQFFLYPTLQTYLVAILVVIPSFVVHAVLNGLSGDPLLSGIDPLSIPVRSQVVLGSRILTAVMGALTALMVFFIGRKMCDWKTGCLAALFLALTIGFVGFSHFATVDIPTTFWMTTTFLLALRALESPTSYRFLQVGFVTGLAVSTKYPAVLMMVPLVTVCFLGGTDKVRKLTLTLLAVFGGFALGTPYAIIRFPTFVAEFVSLTFFQSTYTGEGSPSFIRHLGNLLNISGSFLFSLTLVGFVYCVYQTVRLRSQELFLLVLTITVHYLHLGSIVFSPQRYVIVIVPFLALCGAKLTRDLLAPRDRENRWVPKASLAVLFLGLAFTGIYVCVGLSSFRADDRYLAHNWMRRNVSKTDTVEMNEFYGIHIPPGYDFRPLPYYYRRDTFSRMAANPRYRRIKSLLPWADFGGYEGKLAGPGKEPPTVSLEALLARRPDYLILTKRTYRRFWSKQRSSREGHRRQHRLYHALLEDQTPYRIVADFRDRWRRGWLTPEIEFIHAGVVILRYGSPG